MNQKQFHSRLLILLAGSLLTLPISTSAQTESGDEGSSEEVFEMSPFEVDASGDKGYYASNAISGSRITVPIQDIPLTIEVVTSEFIEDTGAVDLRESLQYSAGILLQSQNDAYGLYDNVGGVNNPEGATGDRSQSSFKVRGFVLENTLRNGFRRQHATDTVNIDRVEVVRGPSALLYGVGNFGGVVNYITKRPLPEPQQNFTLGYGSDNWMRFSFDTTGPLIEDKFAYRINFAAEERDDWTDLNTHEHWFFAPVLEYRPWRRVKLTVDYEYGKADDDAIGFKSVRAPTLEGIPIYETDRLETYGFLEFPGKDVRTFRWSGPDTYLDTISENASANLEIGILEDLYYNGGINYSRVRFETLDVFGGINTNATNPRAQPYKNTILARQIIDGASNDVYVEVDNAVLEYNWSGNENLTKWMQHRHELNYNARIFEGSNWLESEHNFLLGYSFESKDNEGTNFRTDDSPDGTNFMYKDPTDTSYLRFATRADGSPSLPYEPIEYYGGVAENEGTYFVYSGRFFNDRLFLVGGLREDTTTSKDSYFETIGSRQGRIFYEDTTITKDTSQWGVSFEILEGLSVFALSSEGVEPNFDGQRDGAGRALEATVAAADEVGIKVNLFDGKIAGTFSVFKIEREGLPFSYWWAPAPARGQFNRTEAIVYRMDEINFETNPDNRYIAAGADEWAAARASGAIFDDLGPDGRTQYTYLNASTPEGAAFLDAVFAELNRVYALPYEERSVLEPWPGWLYAGFDDPLVNTAAEDWSSGAFYQTISDESKGYEAQLIFSPLDNLQIILNYSHVKREVINPGNFVSYDYAEGNWDRWAPWYFPNGAWGLAGFQPEDVYPGGPAEGLPNEDTASWTGIGWGKGEALDDTPPHVVSWWMHYSFLPESTLAGLELGLGGQWEDGREYASAFTSAGQRKQNETPESIRAVTPARLTVNAMVKYTWTIAETYDTYFQLNVNNLLDDTDQYGFFYAPGISWRFNAGITF